MWHLTLSWCQLSSAHDTCLHTWCWGHTSLGKKINLLGNLELSSLIICRLKIVKQKRSSAYQYQRAHRQKLESEKWKLFFRMITFLKLFLKDEMKPSKLFSIWIVFFSSHIYSQDEQFSSPKLQEARPAGLWQDSDGWLPLTEKDTIQVGIRWGLMGDCHWLRRIQFKKGSDGFRWVQMDSDGFRWIQMGSDGWLPLTEEDTIQEEHFHLSS